MATLSDKARRQQRLRAALQPFVPGSSILHTDEQMRPYECDGLSAYRRMPLLVVLPETLQQVQGILRTCARLETPVVARGAGTGLSAGALRYAPGHIRPESGGGRLTTGGCSQELAGDPDA
jgi:glycolate oxidase